MSFLFRKKASKPSAAAVVAAPKSADTNLVSGPSADTTPPSQPAPTVSTPTTLDGMAISPTSWRLRSKRAKGAVAPGPGIRQLSQASNSEHDQSVVGPPLSPETQRSLESRPSGAAAVAAALLEQIEVQETAWGSSVRSSPFLVPDPAAPVTLLQHTDPAGHLWDIVAGSASIQGSRHDQTEDRSVMGQSVLNSGSSLLYGVFDGHGGSEAAEYLKRRLHVAVEHYLTSTSKAELTDSGFRTALSNAFVDMERVFCAWSKLQDPFLTSGSCAVACVIDREAGTVHIANTGDSSTAIFHVTKKKKISGTLSTRRHSCHDKGEQTRMYEAYVPLQLKSRLFDEDGTVQGLEPSRSIGDIDVKEVFSGAPIIIAEPELTTHKLLGHDEAIFNVVVLASDGLWDVFTYDDAAAVIRERIGNKMACTPELLEETALHLCHLAKNKGSDDDISVVIIVIGEGKKKKK